MNLGVIEQVGTPLEIYREPATAFVADFIGTMNFIPGRIMGPDQVRFGSIDLACDADGLAQGTDVTIAIRPEDIQVQGVEGSEENAIAARIDSMEFLGSFFRAGLAANGTDPGLLRADVSINLVRRLDLSEGDAVQVVMPRERIRIYSQSAEHG